MKSKQLILGFGAFVFAIGAAVAGNALIIRDAYIEVQQFQNGPWICTDSTVDCDDTTTGAACNVKVTTTSAGIKTVRGKLVNTNCVTPLNHINATAQASPLTPYDVR